MDIVIGGLLAADPYKVDVAFTRPYAIGSEQKHYVMALAKGENALMTKLEIF